MDQGISAVLGASVGVLGAVGTAVLTYLAARRQANDQGRVIHRNTLRTERREAYLAFLQAGESIDRALHFIAFGPGRNPQSPPEIEVLSTAIELADRGAHELYASQSRVDLAGPEHVCSAALEVWGAAMNVRAFLNDVRSGRVPQDRYEGQCEERIDEVERRKIEFIEAARSILEESD
ncbi:hypothetical protein [Streptomyces sp. Ru87]|uniref:hypothetical protein n=1 Tax=Streptomyces sp. Ru87 TaxID=2044307 RepID=UPI0015D48A47|nr:hypothetical protein [Streptomyces sp. Ru87]